MIDEAIWTRLAGARVYDLEQPRHGAMPIYPTHKPGYFYALYRRHGDPGPPGPRTSAAGMLTMMEHTGTHIDALCHQAYEGRLCGGVEVRAAESPTGFSEHGIETVPPLVGRGVLLDVAGHEGVPFLPPRSVIGVERLIACAQAQGVEVRGGDVLLVRTGYGQLWDDEPRYLESAGVGKSGSIWAAERGVVAVGADNMSWDAPGDVDPDTGANLFAHGYLLARKGIYIIENLNLEQLAADRRYEFGFLATPLKFRGATGSPIRPIAIVDAEVRATT